MFELYRSQLKGKVYRLIYNMNKRVKIKVKTPVGETQSEEVEDLVTQGSVDSGPMSGVNIDNGVNVAFADSDSEVYYIELKLGPVIFMDDIGRLAETVKSAQEANDRLEALLESKCLDFNIGKSNYLIMGKGRSRKNLFQKYKKIQSLFVINP